MKWWGKQDLNLRPTDYEGGRISPSPVPSNRYGQDLKRLVNWMLLVFAGICEHYMQSIAPPVHREQSKQNSGQAYRERLQV